MGTRACGTCPPIKLRACFRPCLSGCNQQDKVKLMTIHHNSEQRKKLKRYDIPGHAHELTFSCYHRLRYLNDPICSALFIDELSQAREYFLFRLWAYVLMPNHVHLFIYPTQNEYKIAAILQSIKGKTSKRFRDILLARVPLTN